MAQKKAAAKAASPRRRPAARSATPGPTGPIVEDLGPRLRAEFEALERSEAKILRGLASQRNAEEFLKDPAAALRRMKVEVPPIIAARLKHPELLGGAVAPRSYLLPNGQVVTARVTVRFTAGEPRSPSRRER